MELYVESNLTAKKPILMQQDLKLIDFKENTELRRAQIRLLDMLITFDRICKKHKIEYFISGGTCLGAVRHGGFIPWDDDLDVDIMYKDLRKLTKILAKELPPQYFLQTPKTDKSYYHLFPRIVDRNSRMHYPVTNLARRNQNHNGLFLDIFPLEWHIIREFKRIVDKWFVTILRFSRGIGGTPLKRGISRALLPLAWLSIKGLNSLSSFKIWNLLNNQDISHIYGTNIIPCVKYSNVFPTRPIKFEGHFITGPANPHEYLTDLFGDYMEVPPLEKRITHSSKIEVF